MAAALAAINNYFQNVLHIANVDVRNALNDQELHSFDDFGALTEQDIIDICNKARKPGGTHLLMSHQWLVFRHYLE